jgi:hypothetical protein
MSCGQNAGQYHSVKEINVSLGIMEEFICVGTTLTNRTSYKNQEPTVVRECLHSFDTE